MKSSKSYSIHPKHLRNAKALRRTQSADSTPRSELPPAASTVRTTPRDFANPVDYQHPYESMGRFAQALALRYDANRTRHSYYRQLRLLHEHFDLNPALLTETHLRDYFLFVKLQKHWKPKSIRQTLAATRLFFVDLLGHTDWKIFGQIRTKDHDVLPPVLTRREVHTLLAHIRLRRYRTPIKLMSPPALHSIYMMRPACVLALCVGEAARPLRPDALAIATSRSTVFLLGDFGMARSR